MLGRVLVLSASAGAGHVRAAETIECAVRDSGAARDIRHVDVLQYTTKLFQRLYAQAYLDMANHAPEVLGWIYDYLNRPWKHERLRLALDKLNMQPFVKLLESYRPDWTICTHFLPAEVVSWLKGRRRLNTRHAVIVTDFDLHGMWLCRHVERYFVALDETRAHLERLGISGERIVVSGPHRSRFRRGQGP